METKICRTCGTEKSTDEFYGRTLKNGNRSYRSDCIKCYCEKGRIRQQQNRVRYNKKRHETKKKNGTYARREKDPDYRLKQNLRRRILHAVVDSYKSNTTMNLIGCSIPELKQHLQATAIANGYSNFDIDTYDTSKYHIDHIRPCASFDLSKEEEQRKCFHYSNLQILTVSENLTKGDSICQGESLQT